MRSGGTAKLVGLVALLGACAAEQPATLRRGIVGGEPSGADQDGVVMLRAQLEDGSELICSASLVAPNLLLTAQHCVSYMTSGFFSCNARGELTSNPDGGGQLGLSLPPEALEVYADARPRKAPLAKGKQVISTHSTNICQNDIAFVLLDTSLDLPLVPLRLGRPAEVGEVGVLVGYGMDAGQSFIDYRSQPRQQKREQEVRGVGPDSLDEGVTTVAPRTLLLEGPSGCIGDSGGPLLSQRTGAVLGVYSLQVSVACDSPRAAHQLVHVPPFQLLMSDAFEAAGATPVPEGPAPGTQGGEGGAGAEPSAGDGGVGSVEGSWQPPHSSSSCSASRATREQGYWLVPSAALALALNLSRRRRR